MTKTLKQKGRKILKSTKCKYCDYRTSNIDYLKRHEEIMHGYFRDNSKRPTKRILDRFPTPDEKVVVMNGVTYKWNEKKKVYEESELNTTPKNESLQSISTLGDGSYLIKCEKCDRIKRILIDPYKNMNKHQYPAMLCPHCNWNLFKKVETSEVNKWQSKGNIVPKDMKKYIAVNGLKEI